MDESINNIYFLKETIGKFKNELQKFISNPNHLNNNVVVLKQNIEELEKNITKKEKVIANQILNNNIGTFIPIASKIPNRQNNHFSASKPKNTYFPNQTNKPPPNSSMGFNLFQKSLKCYNVKQENMSNINIDKNKTFSSEKNQNMNNTFNKTINSKNFSSYGHLNSLNGRNLNSANIIQNSNINNKLAEDFSINNNRAEVIPNINYIPESYYDLIYKAKRKEIIPEYSTPQFSNGLYTQRINSKNPGEEKNIFKNTLLLRRPKDTLNSNIQELEDFHKNKFQTEKMMEKHNIKTNKTNFKKIQRSAGTINYMDKSRINKFAHHKKPIYTGVTYDKNREPIITQEEINKGILSMINRGLIPKAADLTPAFNRNGHPITLAKGEELKELYTKTKLRDEVELEGQLDKIKYNFSNMDNNFFITSGHNENQSMRDYINYNNVFYNNSASYENDTKDVVKTIPSLDINNIVKKTDVDNINPQTLSNINENDADYIKAMDTKIKENENERDKIRIEDKEPEYEMSDVNMGDIPAKVEEEFLKRVYTIRMLLFKNFKAVENEEYRSFIEKNDEKLGSILYLIDHFQKLFKKLNLNYAEVELEKFENIMKDELRNITNKDLILCLTEKDMKAKGFDNNKTLHLNMKEAFVVRIQKFYRMYRARLNYQELKIKMKKIKKLQRNYRLYRIYKHSKILLEERRTQNLIEWKLMMNQFKADWPNIKKGHRIEIHLNSLGYSFLRNCTMEKFAVKENNQLNRIISLIDPNVEIIYIAPFPLVNEVLSYYFSILSTLGVDNAKERFHLIVPEEINYFAPSFSLTQMFLFSDISLKRVRNAIKGKNAYIVPGVVSKSDMNLSIYLECPILMDEIELTKTLFTKSGSKRVFELTNMAFPISAWDIRNEDEFYNSLIDLIKKYLTVNIWIFKMDSEINGRGIAFIQLDKIKSFIELRKERQSGIIDEENFEFELRLILQKSVPKKSEIITPNLYKNFKYFLKEFCEYQGIIESCPTNSLSGIRGSPSISMLIEPDGNVELVGTYDKINQNYFRNIAVVSPQTSIPNLNIDLIIERLGKYLYKQGIIGYLTIEYITFLDGQKTLFWAVDLKFGYNDIISCIKFCDVLDNYSANKYGYSIQNSIQSNYAQSYPQKENLNTYTNNNPFSPMNMSRYSSNVLSKNESSMSLNLKQYIESHNKYRFILPVIIHSEIANVKMRDLVQMFRNELLVYDLEKRNGIVFNLPDIIQCGMFGICGIAKSKEDCFKLFESSINLLKNMITHKDNKNISLSIEARSDIIEINDLIGRIRYYLKNK